MGKVVRHWSDCAMFNGPALPAGPCDCGAIPRHLSGAQEAVADAWASIDGKLDEFRNGGEHGHREGYLEEAGELIARLGRRGFMIVAGDGGAKV